MLDFDAFNSRANRLFIGKDWRKLRR